VFEDAATRFSEWTDLPASFTDFVVATHMADLGIGHIATYDSYYAAFDVTMVPSLSNWIR
jgi:predicted nucleic acid-binding protein